MPTAPTSIEGLPLIFGRGAPRFEVIHDKPPTLVHSADKEDGGKSPDHEVVKGLLVTFCQEVLTFLIWCRQVTWSYLEGSIVHFHA